MKAEDAARAALWSVSGYHDSGDVAALAKAFREYGEERAVAMRKSCALAVEPISGEATTVVLSTPVPEETGAQEA